MNIKHLIFEEEEEQPKNQVISSSPISTLMPATKGAFTVRPAFHVQPDANNNVAYSKLLEKTAFENSDVSRILTKYLDPLKGLQIDEHAKYKAAVAQAQAQEGLSAGKILATFDGLKHALEDETQHFEETAASMSNQQITEKAKRQDVLRGQIDSLKRELDSLSGEINTAQMKINLARTQFKEAVELRTTELDQQKSHYMELLK